MTTKQTEAISTTRALKLALEALEWFTAAEQGEEPPINKAITAIRAALASKSEALADNALERMAENARELGLDYEPIIERVEDAVGMGHNAWDMVKPKELAKAFHEALNQSRSDEEQPAQRTWIGLTDEEMNAALDYWSEDERSAYGGAHAADGEYVSMIDTWRYIEAKLKEKNGF